MGAYLKGESPAGEAPPAKPQRLTSAGLADLAGRVARALRVPMAEEPPEARVNDFREVAQGYGPDEAMAEASRCLAGLVEGCIGCGECGRLCEAGAIDLHMKDETVELGCDAIVLAPGFDLYDPTEKREYGYGTLDGVMTGIEFERLCSVTGPTGGDILFKGRTPRRFFFIQCVGSRDRQSGARFCSRVCCMYTAKHASIVKDRVKDAEIYVSYIDVRAYGKSYEEFYKSAQEAGVLYIRGIPGEVTRGRGGLLVRVEDMLSGSLREIEVDLVVLATGVRPRRETEELCAVMAVERDEYGFIKVNAAAPSKTGVTGHLRLRHGLRPERRARYGRLGGRGGIALPGIYKQGVRRVKAGVFICHCGHNIKQTVDVKRLREYFGSLPHVAVAADYPFVCSEPGQDLVRESIEKEGLDRVVIASCTPSLHQELFQNLLKKARLNPYLLQRVGIREHCSWVGDDVEKNTEKAMRLIRAGLYAAAHSTALEEKEVEVTKSALILGGGVSGLCAALFLSSMGMHVSLVEREARLGGHVRTLKDIWPIRQDGEAEIGRMEEELRSRENVDIFTSTRVSAFEGSFGNYRAVLASPAGEAEIVAGGVICAIGFSPFDARLKPELCYGRDKRIMTTVDFEARAHLLSLPEKPRVAILHCVGSRDEQIGRPYCSRICCINALRVGEAVRERYPDSYVESFYMDVRAHPRGGEEFYEETQELGVLFTRGSIGEIVPTPEGLSIRGEDTLLGEVFERQFDLAVLSIGMSPPADNHLTASLLKIALDKDGFFLEAHVKLRPYDTAVKGIFIAGACSGPKDMEEAINHGRASAVKLFGLLSQGAALVDPFIAVVDEKRCSGCRMCEKACVAKAIKYDEAKRVVRVEEAACMGCGLCNSTCPSSAIALNGHIDRLIADEIGGMVEVL